MPIFKWFLFHYNIVIHGALTEFHIIRRRVIFVWFLERKYYNP